MKHRVASLVCVLAAAVSAHASTNATYKIYIPKTAPYFTASTYQPNVLIANSVWNGFSLQNSGCPVSLSVGSSGSYYVFTLTVSNIPAGVDTFAIVRWNKNGNLGYTGHKTSLKNGTVDLGSVTFN